MWWCQYYDNNFFILSILGLRAKIPIIKNWGLTLKRGKNALWGRQNTILRNHCSPLFTRSQIVSCVHSPRPFWIDFLALISAPLKNPATNEQTIFDGVAQIPDFLLVFNGRFFRLRFLKRFADELVPNFAFLCYKTCAGITNWLTKPGRRHILGSGVVLSWLVVLDRTYKLSRLDYILD